jgi:hypothetical protein
VRQGLSFLKSLLRWRKQQPEIHLFYGFKVEDVPVALFLS